ncbi:MAG: hypothetical protein GY861_12600 [bacterium]|nr:hypothetical protein [bacterium]
MNKSPYEVYKINEPLLILHFEAKYLIGGLVKRHRKDYSDEEVKRILNVYIDEELMEKK